MTEKVNNIIHTFTKTGLIVGLATSDIPEPRRSELIGKVKTEPDGSMFFIEKDDTGKRSMTIQKPKED